jgi:site-specific recombinase XerD
VALDGKQSGSNPTGSLVVAGRADRPVYEAKWRRTGRQVKRRIGPAWLERAGDGSGWLMRRGRVPEGYFDEKRATVRMAELIAEHDREERAIEAGERERRERGVSFRELAAEWLEHLRHERGAKPSTLSDYRYMLAEPGTPHRRGGGKSPGVLMAAFGDRPAAKITTREVSTFLRRLDTEGVSPRSVNKNRQVLSAIFGYACRGDTHGLPSNPVAGDDQTPRAPAERCSTSTSPRRSSSSRRRRDGAHRGPQPPTSKPTRSSGGRARTRRTASCFVSPPSPDCASASCSRCAGRTSTSTCAASSSSAPSQPASRARPRAGRRASSHSPIPAAEAFQRLLARGTTPQREDYVFCSRLGRRLDPSAVRRRFKRRTAAAGLRPLRFHALRHAAGSLIARHADARFVQAFLGHSRITTTERYMHAKARPEDLERVNLAFAARSSNDRESSRSNPTTDL